MTRRRKVAIGVAVAVFVIASFVAEHYAEYPSSRRSAGFAPLFLVLSIPAIAGATVFVWWRDPVAADRQTRDEQRARYRATLGSPGPRFEPEAAGIPLLCASIPPLIALLLSVYGWLDAHRALVLGACFLALLALALPLALWHRPRFLLPAMYRGAYRADAESPLHEPAPKASVRAAR